MFRIHSLLNRVSRLWRVSLVAGVSVAGAATQLTTFRGGVTVKKHLLLMCAVFLILGLGASSAFAQNTSLQALGFNENGSLTVDAAAPGVSLSGYNTSTGLGTITYSTTTSGYFDTIFELPVSVPFYNEYGAVVGTPGSTSESWEIDNLLYVNTSIVNDWAGNSLSDFNDAPEGASDNYLGTCDGGAETTVGDCNGWVAEALGDAFVVSAGDKETITINVSQTAPSGGFYLMETHPVDLERQRVAGWHINDSGAEHLAADVLWPGSGRHTAAPSVSHQGREQIAYRPPDADRRACHRALRECPVG
jgi:hypothetical protein